MLVRTLFAWPSSVAEAWQWSGEAFESAVAYASEHTGVPAVVVAAGLLVVSYRIFKKALRFAIELAAALVVVLVATKLGWIAF